MNGVQGIWVGLALTIAAVNANAWVAVGMDKASSATYLSYNAASPESAAAGALQDCRKDHRSQCVISGNPVQDTALVIAKGNGGITWAANRDPEKAAAEALANCNKAYSGCHFGDDVWDSGPKWMAFAMGSDGFGFVDSQSTSREAEAGALENCKKNSGPATAARCSVKSKFTFQGKAWFVMWQSKTRTEFGWGATEQQADATAHGACMKSAAPGDNTCKQMFARENAGPTPAPTSFKVVDAMVQEAHNAYIARQKVASAAPRRDVGGDCRPRTEYLQCSSDCTNGSCTVSYTNGCKIHVNVRPAFNGMTNSWDYPSPSC